MTIDMVEPPSSLVHPSPSPTNCRPAQQSKSSGTKRLVGIDVARAAALIGMFTQHAHPAGPEGEPSTGWVGWLFTESAGRASVLFFLLSGVSLAMIHRHGSFTATPSVLRRRGLLLLTGGILLTASIWPGSILQHYGVMFLLAPWLLRLGRRGLGITTAAGLVGGPVAMLWAPRLGGDVYELWKGESGSWLIAQVWDLAVGGLYPLIIWIGFFTLGMLIGRVDVGSRRVVYWLLAAGLVGTFAFGTIAKTLATNFDGDLPFDATVAGEPEPADEGNDSGLAGRDDLFDKEAFLDEQKVFDKEAFFDVEEVPARWQDLYDTTGHSGRMGWTLQTSCIAIAILGLALALPRRLHRALRPLAALGSMSLTAYLVHIVLVTDVWEPYVSEAGWSIISQEWVFAGLVGVMTLACVIFHRILGGGPLEQLLRHFTLRPGDRRETTRY